jgi:hypothetical protein
MHLLIEDLSKDGTAAQSTTWSCHANDLSCSPYYLPNNAVDGDTSTCTRTSFFGGSFFPDKTAWWYVDLGEIRSVYSVGIQFRDYIKEYGQKYGNDYRYVHVELCLSYSYMYTML